MLFKVLENVGFQIGAGRYVHDFENGDQRKVVVERVGPGDQLAQPAKQLLQPQVGSEAFVEGVLVKNHAGGFLEAQGEF